MPKLSLPVRLVLLVAGTTLPLIVFAVGIVFYNYQQDRRDATQRVLETVRSIRLVLDAEMQRMTGGLQVLALTNALRNGDFDGFRRHRHGFLDQYGKDGVVLVADRERPPAVLLGHERIPRACRRATIATSSRRCLRPSSRNIPNLFIGAVKKRPIVTVEVPVLRDGEVVYVHLLQPADRDIPGHHREAAAERGLDDVDLRRRRHQFRARAQSGRRRSASAPRRRCMLRCSGRPEATLSTVSLEGVPLITSLYAIAR